MDMRRLVGRNVRSLRLADKLTQEQFAELSGFSQQYISDLERGRRNPTVVTLFELAQALGSNPIALITPDDGAGPAHTAALTGQVTLSPNGMERKRLPVATKIALASAGANGGTPGSPTPVACTSNGCSTMVVLTCSGYRFIRAIG